MWNLFLFNPILNTLIFFYKVFGQNLGLAILGLTIFIRLILLPLVLPSLKMAKKQKEISHLVDGLKKKHRDDKKKLAEEQLKLFQEHGINPASGCLPQIVQILILIALYRVLIMVLENGQAVSAINQSLYFAFLNLDPAHQIQTQFLFWDLAKPDPIYILPILAGISQFVMSKMMMGKSKNQKNKKTKKQIKEEQLSMSTLVKKESVDQKSLDSQEDMMYSMQQQMMYLMPLMTVIIGIKFPAGLALYWVLSTLFSIGQQWAMERFYR